MVTWEQIEAEMKLLGGFAKFRFDKERAMWHLEIGFVGCRDRDLRQAFAMIFEMKRIERAQREQLLPLWREYARLHGRNVDAIPFIGHMGRWESDDVLLGDDKTFSGAKAFLETNIRLAQTEKSDHA